MKEGGDYFEARGTLPSASKLFDMKEGGDYFEAAGSFHAISVKIARYERGWRLL